MSILHFFYSNSIYPITVQLRIFATNEIDMEEIEIKIATAVDLETVQRIARETFVETFADSNTEADMKHYLENRLSEDQLASERANPCSIFYLAWENNQAIGYLKVNSGNAQTEQQDLSALEIERIYVKQTHHGKKVGQLLFEKALSVAKDLNSQYVWLGVWEKNLRAIRFYEKNGFIAFDKHIFRMGQDEQTDIMMKKELAQPLD